MKLNKTKTFKVGFERRNVSNNAIERSLDPPSTPKFIEFLNPRLSAINCVYECLLHSSFHHFVKAQNVVEVLVRLGLPFHATYHLLIDRNK